MKRFSKFLGLIRRFRVQQIRDRYDSCQSPVRALPDDDGEMPDASSFHNVDGLLPSILWRDADDVFGGGHDLRDRSRLERVPRVRSLSHELQKISVGGDASKVFVLDHKQRANSMLQHLLERIAN